MDTLTRLYVEVSTLCNLDCAMCMRTVWSEPLGHMPVATFAALMRQLGEFPAPPLVHLGGYGEPMGHPDFLTLVGLAKAAGAEVAVTTNGTLLTQDAAVELVRLGLDRLNVSLDGTTPVIYGQTRIGADYDQVLENMLGLRRAILRRKGKHGKPYVGLAFVAMERNITALPGLPRLASRLGARFITVSNVVPHSAAMEGEILYRGALKACAYREPGQVPELSLPKLDVSASTVEPLRGALSGTASISLLDASLSSRNDYCRFCRHGYAAVRWDGAVSPCLSLLHDHPEHIRGRRKQVTHYSLGNVTAQPLAEIWASPEYVAFRSRLRTFRFSPCTTCGGCERFEANAEDCMGNTFPACGGCLWAQGFVQCP